MLIKKKNKALTKMTTLYISDKHRHLIISPKQENKIGINWEQDKCITSSYPVEPEILGQYVIDALNNYRLNDVKLISQKITEWPAYRHSKSKSVTAFENEYIQITIESQFNTNIILNLIGYPFKNSELNILSSVSFYADNKLEIGQRLINIYNACLTGKLF
jgi:hypothetical protein